MKAITYSRYGPPDVLELKDVEPPEVPDVGVLVRVRAAAVNPVEWHALTGTPYIARTSFGLRKPKSERLGVDFAGTVEAVGSSVTQFAPGDEVFGARDGALAEYVCVSEERGIVPKPANVTFEQAGAVAVAGVTALQGLRDKGGIQAGHQVLVNGASGGVGTFAVQIAKALGAEVTGVCSTRNVEQARSLGADHVVDYTREDFTRGDRRYDLMLDIAGNRSWSECKRVLAPDATLVLVGGPKTSRLLGPIGHVLRMKLAAMRGSRTLAWFIAQTNKDDLAALQELMAAGKLKPVVERTYALADTAEALRYLGEGHAQGKLVVTVRGFG